MQVKAAQIDGLHDNMPSPASFAARLMTDTVEVGTPTGAGVPLSVAECPAGTPAASHNFYTIDSSDIGGTDFFIYVSPLPMSYIRQRCIFINDGKADIDIHVSNSDSSLHTLITEYCKGYTLRSGTAAELNFITTDNTLEESEKNIYGNFRTFKTSIVNGVITTCTIESNDFGISKERG